MVVVCVGFAAGFVGSVALAHVTSRKDFDPCSFSEIPKFRSVPTGDYTLNYNGTATFFAPQIGGSGRHVQGSLHWSFTVTKDYDTQRAIESSYSVCGSDDQVVPNPKSLTCHELVSVKKSVGNAQATGMVVYEWEKPNQRLVQSGGMPINLVGQKCMLVVGNPFSPTFLSPAVQKRWDTAATARFTFICSKKPRLPQPQHFKFDETKPVGFDLGGLDPNFTYTIDSTVTLTGDVGAICSSS